MNKQVALIIAIIVAAVAAVVYLLTTGGTAPISEIEDGTADLEVVEGPNAPEETALADIVNAEVVSNGNEIVFRARFAEALPEKIRGQELELRWDLSQDGQETWLVSASIDPLEPSAAIVSNVSDYGAGTFDHTLPGDLEVAGDTLTVRLRPEGIPQFPTTFDWVLESSLDADLGEPTSGRVEDRAPDQGYGQYSAGES